MVETLPEALTPMRATDMRRQNRRVVLDQLRQNNRMSRRELVASTSLTSQSLADILADLVEDGLVVELRIREAQSGRGRPPLYYEANAAAGMALGLFVGRRTTTVVAADARGTEVARCTAETPVGDFEAAIDTIVSLVGAVRGRAPSGPASAVIALHGRIDTDRGVCMSAPSLGWTEVPVVDRFVEQLGVPASVVMASHAVALAEHREGLARGLSDAVVLHLGMMPAAGILLGGKVFRGHDGQAGLIRGCVVPDPTGKEGDYGSPLDGVASGVALVNRYLASSAGGSSAQWAVDVTTAAAAGDTAAMAVLSQASDAVVVAARWLIGCFGPQALILSGGLVDVPDAHALPLVNRIYASLAPAHRAAIRIGVSPLGADGPVRGAVLGAVGQLALSLDG